MDSTCDIYYCGVIPTAAVLHIIFSNYGCRIAVCNRIGRTIADYTAIYKLFEKSLYERRNAKMS